MEANQARNRKRAVLWYNTPYSINVKTKTFFKLLQKDFPPKKISCSCFPNMGSIISSHNKHILNLYIYIYIYIYIHIYLFSDYIPLKIRKIRIITVLKGTQN